MQLEAFHSLIEIWVFFWFLFGPFSLSQFLLSAPNIEETEHGSFTEFIKRRAVLIEAVLTHSSFCSLLSSPVSSKPLRLL